MFGITPSARLRPSPYYEATLAEGVKAFTTYNHMLMPTSFGDPEGEYWRLMNGVSQWDVAVERQVELRGPDAGRLAQILTARDLTRCVGGQGKYVPLCNHDGVLINDPILLKLADDHYWLSIADSNIWFWARAIAAERRLHVEVSEPDVSPMAVQGPKAEDVVAALDKVEGMRCVLGMFEGVVTGAADKGTWVRVRRPPVEGRGERGYEGLRVGDTIRVKLIRTDPARGFIDFVRV